MSTLDQFDSALASCRDIFEKKLKDYGASWRIMRPRSITDQLYIKAKRIRTLEEGEAMVNEGVLGEFMAIVNYGIVGLIQLEYGYADEVDMSPEKALELYDKNVRMTRDLLAAKTLVSEGVDSNYMDIINYAIFAIIKLTDVNG